MWATPSRFLACALAAAGLCAQAAPVPEVDVGEAPPLGRLRVGEVVELGDDWDDVHAAHGARDLLLVRGRTLYRLPSVKDEEPQEWSSTPQLDGSRIVTHFRIDGVSWLLCESRSRAPFVWSPDTGQVLELEVPGLLVPPDRPPTIQSWVLAPHTDAALLMVSGGERRKWPRPDNRPVYFWAGFGDGKGTVVRLPLGFDLDYFSSDQRVAVFDAPAGASKRRRLAALDLVRGAETEEVPLRSVDGWIAFDWGNRDAAQPVIARRGADRRKSIVGVAFAGRAYDLGLEIEDPSLPRAAFRGGWWAMHSRQNGRPEPFGKTLWFGTVTGRHPPALVAHGVMDCSIPGDGLCAFTVCQGMATVRETGRSRVEPFVYDAKRGEAWTVLDGVERLKPLDPRVRKALGIGDRVDSRLVEGFDVAARPGLALFWCRHDRGDMRHRRGGAPVIPSEEWSAMVLVTGDGRRFAARGSDLPPDLSDGRMWPLLWLFDTGRLFLWQPTRLGPAPGNSRLVMVDLGWPD